MPELQPGIYFDNTRGWHISAKVVELAFQQGFEYGEEAPPEYRKALVILENEGCEALEGYAVEHEDMLQWLEEDATRYIETLIPEGCWCGYSEGFGDWGVWGEAL